MTVPTSAHIPILTGEPRTRNILITSALPYVNNRARIWGTSSGLFCQWMCLPDTVAAVLKLRLNLIHLLAALVAPLMPATAAKMEMLLQKERLRIPDVWSADSVCHGHVVRQAEYLFERIDTGMAEVWRREFGGGA